ncbi:MAG TPA: hypothetical protein VLB27_00145 [candidate division Zixibacteria bacterium]|nr:hypothetical protein [candidate division Zixibacteria bacterium]
MFRLRTSKIRTTLALTLLIGASGATVAQDSAHTLTRVTAVRDAYPCWSPDGSQIVFQSDRNSSASGHFHIHIMNTDGSDIRQVTFGETSDETPVWSPDGSRILYSSYLTDENNELFIMNVDGSDIRRLTNNPGLDGHQKFSPDGTRIIFNRSRDTADTYNIYEMNVDGSDIRQLTDFEDWDTYPSISPDGSRILWRRVLPTGGNTASGRNSEIFVMNRDGSDPVNISNHPDFDGYPAWAPDGSKIAFASNRDPADGNRGNFHLYIMNPDGSGVTRVLENEKYTEDARPMWSSDGSQLLFNRQYVADESSIDILIVNLPAELRAGGR